MTTLYTQKPRNAFPSSDKDLESLVGRAVKIAKAHGVAVADVIAAARVLELERTNNLYHANGDAFDEQLAGIGEELQNIVSAIAGLQRSGT